MSMTVELRNGSSSERLCIKTTIATNEAQVDEVIQAMMSNSLNHKRLIGLDLIPMQSRPRSESILQLCDSSQCLIFRLRHYDGIPKSLYNFLILPNFTFVGFGIKDSKARLDKDYDLFCKNVLELGPELWINSVYHKKFLRDMYNNGMEMPPTSSISKPWGSGHELTEDEIKVAVSNAFFAFRIAETVVSF